MKIQRLIKKFLRVWEENSFFIAVGRVLHFIGNIDGRKKRRKDVKYVKSSRGEVLFINGCCMEHPTRYRVLHQMEQLEEAGISCAKVYFEDLELEMETNYQRFIFYRCECTDEVAAFIERAKKHHKVVCFDIDDLVIDTKYTDLIPFVQELSAKSRRLFDHNVRMIGKTLTLCDVATTTTETLAEELGKVVSKTFINRNTASKEMIACAEKAYHFRKRDSEKVWIGYFSGSLTHNKDFEVVRSALIRILKIYPNAGLLLVGELDTSDELNQFPGRVKKLETTDWRKLPELIVQADINLAPLEDTLFNRAKSELKWLEASLVRVVTIASKVGAFERMIEDGVTGVLCENTEDEWYEKLTELFENSEKRELIAQNSYQYVKEHCSTEKTCFMYAQITMDDYKEY